MTYNNHNNHNHVQASPISASPSPSVVSMQRLLLSPIGNFSHSHSMSALNQLPNAAPSSSSTNDDQQQSQSATPPHNRVINISQSYAQRVDNVRSASTTPPHLEPTPPPIALDATESSIAISSSLAQLSQAAMGFPSSSSSSSSSLNVTMPKSSLSTFNANNILHANTVPSGSHIFQPMSPAMSYAAVNSLNNSAPTFALPDSNMRHTSNGTLSSVSQLLQNHAGGVNGNGSIMNGVNMNVNGSMMSPSFAPKTTHTLYSSLLQQNSNVMLTPRLLPRSTLSRAATPLFSSVPRPHLPMPYDTVQALSLSMPMSTSMMTDGVESPKLMTAEAATQQFALLYAVRDSD